MRVKKRISNGKIVYVLGGTVISEKVFDGAGDDMNDTVRGPFLPRYIPKNMIDRPKQGFGLPLNSWLRGPLRDWVESIFEKNKIEESGLNNSLVRKIWKQQLDGKNSQEKIWSIIMYMQWHKRIFRL